MREYYTRLIEDEETLNKLTKEELIAKLIKTQNQLVDAIVGGQEDYQTLKTYMHKQFSIMGGSSHPAQPIKHGFWETLGLIFR